MKEDIFKKLEKHAGTYWLPENLEYLVKENPFIEIKREKGRMEKIFYDDEYNEIPLRLNHIFKHNSEGYYLDNNFNGQPEDYEIKKVFIINKV